MTAEVRAGASWSTDRLAGCRACGMRATIEDRDRIELADLPIAPSRSTMTQTAGVWPTIQVGRHVHPVSWAAPELGVALAATSFAPR